jgi:hypothetical protein
MPRSLTEASFLFRQLSGLVETPRFPVYSQPEPMLAEEKGKRDPLDIAREVLKRAPHGVYAQREYYQSEVPDAEKVAQLVIKDRAAGKAAAKSGTAAKPSRTFMGNKPHEMLRDMVVTVAGATPGKFGAAPQGSLAHRLAIHKAKKANKSVLNLRPSSEPTDVETDELRFQKRLGSER